MTTFSLPCLRCPVVLLSSFNDRVALPVPRVCSHSPPSCTLFPSTWPTARPFTGNNSINPEYLSERLALFLPYEGSLSLVHQGFISFTASSLSASQA